MGIGGVQGYDKNPKKIPLGVPAQRRTEAGSRQAEVTRSAPSTTPKPSGEQEGLVPKKSMKEPVLQLERLPKALDQAVHQTLPQRSDPGTSATGLQLLPRVDLRLRPWR